MLKNNGYKIALMSILILLLLSSIAYAKTLTEPIPIFAEPEGAQIGELEKGFEIGEHNVLGTRGDWAQVVIDEGECTITGWINEPMTITTTKIDEDGGIDGNFVYRKISYEKAGDMTEIRVKLTNNSGKDYSSGRLIVKFYNDSVEEIGTGNINVSDFSDGQTKTFTEIVDIDYSQIDSCLIHFENSTTE